MLLKDFTFNFLTVYLGIQFFKYRITFTYKKTSGCNPNIEGVKMELNNSLILKFRKIA